MDTLSVKEICSLLASAPAHDLPTLLLRFSPDTRSGVVAATRRAARRMEAHDRESNRLLALAQIEHALIDAGCVFVAGVDEVGRGALAGPVTAAACVFGRDTHVEGVRDSKTLSPQAREVLAAEIVRRATATCVAHVSPAEIDRIGIQAATHNAMRVAVRGLGLTVDHVVVDGSPVSFGLPSTAIVRGDGRVRAIAAASIIAKVARDALMVEMDPLYPGYGLGANKGYGSAEHMEAIREIGPSPIHRRSFAPCSGLTLF